METVSLLDSLAIGFACNARTVVVAHNYVYILTDTLSLFVYSLNTNSPHVLNSN